LISYDNVPTRLPLVLEGQHYRLFFGVGHVSTMRSIHPGFQFSLRLPSFKVPNATPSFHGPRLVSYRVCPGESV
jgi:hypothetical protein